MFGDRFMEVDSVESISDETGTPNMHMGAEFDRRKTKLAPARL